MDARVELIDVGDAQVPEDDKNERWDGASVHDFDGSYGDYILGRVAKVFPEIRRRGP